MEDAMGESKRAVIVVGAGEGTGAAVAKRFAREGLIACVARRSAEALSPLVEEIEAAGGQARAFAVDATDEDAVVELFNTVESEVGEIAVAVYNAASIAIAPIVETSTETYRTVWEVSALGAFLVGREAAKRMLPRGSGTILFTGATAALRGGARFGAFAGGKHAQRALAQSMARELGPQGIHVAHIIIDGIIDAPRSRQRMPQMFADKAADDVLDPDAIAQVYWQLAQQPRSAWTFEIDLRPARERW
ncbi:MAG: SDR family oxidoreductase [Haliangiales bacterium]